MSVAPMTDVPDLQSEVNRKCYDTLHSLISRLESGKITEAQFGIAVEVLFEALSGLISDKDFFYFIGELRKRAPEKVVSVAVFANTETIFVARHELGSESLVVFKGEISQAKKYDLSGETDPDLAAKKQMEAAAARFIESGYRRVA